MRFEWLICAALLACTVGCGSSGGYPVVPSPDPGGSATPPTDTVDSDTGSATSSTDWQLLDDTVLKVSVDPPSSTDVKLQASRRYDTEAHAPLKSLHYRVVTDATPDAEWIALPEPTKKNLSDGMFDCIYETSVTLPQGNAAIQFKVDQGFGEPYELTDWTIEVK